MIISAAAVGGTIRKTIDAIKINTLNVKILKGEMVDELKRLHESQERKGE